MPSTTAAAHLSCLGVDYLCATILHPLCQGHNIIPGPLGGDGWAGLMQDEHDTPQAVTSAQEDTCDMMCGSTGKWQGVRI